jgi:hypothetical protein
MRSGPPKIRKPGAGLGHLFPSEEPKTAKMPALAANPDLEFLCPACEGELDSDANDRAPCPTCHAIGRVSQAIFDRYVADHPDCRAASLLAAKQENTA